MKKGKKAEKDGLALVCFTKKRVTAFRDKRAIIHFPTEEFWNINY